MAKYSEVISVPLYFSNLKYVRKLCSLYFKIVAIFQPCIQFVMFRYRFKALSKWSLIFDV